MTPAGTRGHVLFTLTKMATTLCGRLFPKQGWLPLTQSVRHGSKAVTRHKKPMHILKQKLMAVTQYTPPKPPIPRGAYPPVIITVKEETGLMLLLKKEVKTVFQDCKMIAVIQNNSINAEDMLILKRRLHKDGITIKFIPNEVMRLFLKDGIYCNLLPLFIGHTMLVVSKEPKAKELLLTLKGSPQIVLLGACVENTLLSPEGLLSYSKLPSVSVVQGELVSGLTVLTSRTAALLQRHPAHLSALLQQYVTQQSPEAGGEQEAPKVEETV